MLVVVFIFDITLEEKFTMTNKEKLIQMLTKDHIIVDDFTEQCGHNIPNRKPKENGVADYLKAIDEAVKSDKYDYVFTAQNPDIVHGIIALGYEVHYLKPLPTDQSETIFRQRTKERGNNDNWIDGTIKFLKPSPLSIFNKDELKHVYVHLVPSEYYVTDVLEKGIL